jgi:hypothetical protein
MGQLRRGGNFKTTYGAVMRAFDKLPPRLRDFLNYESAEEWSPHHVLIHYRSLRRDGLSEANALREVVKTWGALK